MVCSLFRKQGITPAAAGMLINLNKDNNKRPVGLIAPPFIISFLATGN